MNLSRTALLVGEEGIEKLNNSKVFVFGLGGVGSAVSEALIRSGIGNLIFIDGDVVQETNLNRQLIADATNIGCKKADVQKERAERINPEVKAEAHSIFYDKNTLDAFNFKGASYVVDAIDTVTSKLLIIERAKEAGVPVISCMGTGNKLDPLAFKIADISKTSVCPLAKVMRTELKKRGIKDVKVLYSEEQPIKPSEPPKTRKSIPGSISSVPPAAGFIIAGEVIKDILNSPIVKR